VAFDEHFLMVMFNENMLDCINMFTGWGIFWIITKYRNNQPIFRVKRDEEESPRNPLPETRRAINDNYERIIYDLEQSQATQY
jgi:hypothetical protein